MHATLSLSALCLTAALAAQPPGNFTDHVVWDYTLRYVQDFVSVDDDGDGMAALWAAAPGPATLYRLDENGARTDIRGPTNTRFAHEFVVGRVLPGHGHTAVVASNSGGVDYLSFYSTDGAGARPVSAVPGSIGFLLDLVLGNFDADAEDEVGVLGTAGWGYFDGGTSSFVPVRTGLAPGALSPFALVQRNAAGPDSLIVPTGTAPIEVREHDVSGGSTLLDTLPASEAQVQSVTWVGDAPVLSTNDGSFATPHGKIWFFDRATRGFDEVVTGQPDESFPRVSGGPIVTERVWFFVRKRFGGVERIEEMDGPRSTPRIAVQGPANIGLDVADGGAREMFTGNTRHLVVRQAATANFATYQVERSVDLRLSGRGATTGNSLGADVFLGSAGAGATVYPLMSLAGSNTLPIPGLGSISLTPDVLTGPSVAFLGGPRSADSSGTTQFQLVVPRAPIGRLRAEVSLGFVALGCNGQVFLNQTGGFGHVEMQ